MVGVNLTANVTITVLPLLTGSSAADAEHNRGPAVGHGESICASLQSHLVSREAGFVPARSALAYGEQDVHEDIQVASAGPNAHEKGTGVHKLKGALVERGNDEEVRKLKSTGTTTKLTFTITKKYKLRHTERGSLYLQMDLAGSR